MKMDSNITRGSYAWSAHIRDREYITGQPNTHVIDHQNRPHVLLIAFIHLYRNKLSEHDVPIYCKKHGLFDGSLRLGMHFDPRRCRLALATQRLCL